MGVCNAKNTLDSVYDNVPVPNDKRRVKRKKSDKLRKRSVGNGETSRRDQKEVKKPPNIEDLYGRSESPEAVGVAKEPYLSSSIKSSEQVSSKGKKSSHRPTNLIVPSNTEDFSEYEEMEAVDLKIPRIPFPWIKEKVYLMDVKHVNDLYGFMEEERARELEQAIDDCLPKTTKEYLFSDQPKPTDSYATQKISTILKNRKPIVESLQKEYLRHKCNLMKEFNAPPKTLDHIRSECLKELYGSFKYLETEEPETYHILKPQNMTDKDFKLFETEAQLYIALADLHQIMNFVSVNYLKTAYNIYCKTLKQGYNDQTEKIANKIMDIFQGLNQTRQVSYWRLKLTKALKKRVLRIGFRQLESGNFEEGYKFLRRCLIDYCIPKKKKSKTKEETEGEGEEEEKEDTEEDRESYKEKLERLQEVNVEIRFLESKANRRILLGYMECLVRTNKKPEAELFYSVVIENNLVKRRSTGFYSKHRDFLEHESFLKFLVFTNGGSEYQDVKNIRRIVETLRSENEKEKKRIMTREDKLRERTQRRKRKMQSRDEIPTSSEEEEEERKEIEEIDESSESEDEEVINLLNLSDEELLESVDFLKRQIAVLEAKGVSDQVPRHYSYLGQTYYKIGMDWKARGDRVREKQHKALAIKCLEKSVSHYFSYLMNTKSFARDSDLTNLILSRKKRLSSKKNNRNNNNKNNKNNGWNFVKRNLIKNNYDMMFTSPLFTHFSHLQKIQNFLLDLLITHARNYVKSLSYLENNKIFRMKCMMTHGFIIPKNLQNSPTPTSSTSSLFDTSSVTKKCDFDLSYLSVKGIKARYMSIAPKDRVSCILIYRLSKLSKFSKFRNAQKIINSNPNNNNNNNKKKKKDEDDVALFDGIGIGQGGTNYAIHTWIFSYDPTADVKQRKVKVIFKKVEASYSDMQSVRGQNPNIEVQSNILISKIRKYIPSQKNNNNNNNNDENKIPMIIVRETPELGNVHFDKLWISNKGTKTNQKDRLGRAYCVSVYDSVKMFLLHHSFRTLSSHGEIRNILYIRDSDVDVTGRMNTSRIKRALESSESEKTAEKKTMKFWPITFDENTSSGLSKLFSAEENRPKLVVFGDLKHYSDAVFLEDFQDLSIDLLSPLLERRDCMTIIHASFGMAENKKKNNRNNNKRKRSSKGIGLVERRRDVSEWIMEWYRSIGGSALLLLNSDYVSMKQLEDVVSEIAENKGDVRSVINASFLPKSEDTDPSAVGTRSYLYFGDMMKMRYDDSIIPRSTEHRVDGVRKKKKKKKKLAPLKKKNLGKI